MAFLSFPSPTQLKNLANPTDNQDAVTLAYLDTALNGSGNIVVANVSANIVTSNNVTANTVTVNGVINLGDVANVKIDGGTDGYVLSTDGTGNLSWIEQTSGGTALPSVTVDSFVADGSTNSYQLSVTPADKTLVFVNVDGVFQIRDSFDLFGNAISFGSTPLDGSVIEVSTFVVGAGGGSGSNIDLTSVSSNIIPSANITYDLGSPTNRWRDIYLSGTTIDLAGATIKTDPTTGAIALIPQPTVAVPNPTGIVITASGTLATVSTTAGVANVAQFSNAISNSANFASTDYVDASIANVVSGTTVTAYASSSSFPSSADGAMAFALDTAILYYRNSSEWVAVKSSNPQYIHLNQPGAITTPMTGTARFYPKGNITIGNVYAYLGTPSSTNLTFNIYKNGSNVGLFTVSANSYVMTMANTSISMTSSDYLTLGVASGTGATDLKVDLGYL